MFNSKMTAFMLTICLCCTGCSAVTSKADKLKGVIKLEDNGIIEKALMWGWEFLTGNELGYTLEDLAKEDALPVDMTVIVVQNYVEWNSMKRGISREQSLEELLHMAGYDKNVDGKIEITKDEAFIAKKRLIVSRDRKNMFLKSKK